jgi:threonine dehydratase
MPDDITLRDVYRARQRIEPLTRRTPLTASRALDVRVGAPVLLKLENFQVTGSFKARGAANKLLSLTEAEKARGVITVSSGNHGRAVAYVAGKLDVPAVVCVSEAVPAHKTSAICDLGAEVVVGGATYDDADRYALALRAERDLTFVSPFDDPAIIAGQGTIGLELLEDAPDIDHVIVPLSGGGLIGGIARVLKTADPAIRVTGVTMERGPAMVDSLKAGHVVPVVEEPTLADALAGGLGDDNAYTFALAQRYVDDTALVSEDEIARGMAFALAEHQIVVEGGGAVGIAALLAGKIANPGKRIAVVVSGGNVGMDVLLDIAGRIDIP